MNVMTQAGGNLLGYGRDVFEPEHEAFRDTARRFFQREVEPNIRQWEKDGFFPRELFKEAAKYGLLCAGIPEEYGGMGGDFLHHAILYEEHGYSPVGAALEGGLLTDSVAYCMLAAGTEEQKREWLPRFASGEEVGEVGVTEPHSGSDPRSMKTTARRDGDDYIINGQKMWMTNSPIGTMLIVAARIADAEERQGVSMFIVDFREAKGKGLTVSNPLDLMLKSAGGVAQIFMEDLRVPKEAILGGAPGRGLGAALGVISLCRMAQAARMMAACELAWKLTLDFVRDREAFGQRVLDFQNTQFKLAQMKAEISVGRTYVDQMLKNSRTGDIDPIDASIAKLWVSELEARVMDECLQLFGAAGFSNEYPISKMYAFARVHRLYLGTSEIQKLNIARTFS